MDKVKINTSSFLLSCLAISIGTIFLNTVFTKIFLNVFIPKIANKYLTFLYASDISYWITELSLLTCMGLLGALSYLISVRYIIQDKTSIPLPAILIPLFIKTIYIFWTFYTLFESLIRSFATSNLHLIVFVLAHSIMDIVFFILLFYTRKRTSFEI